jgi:3-methyl-2-oxobutanoate hydroxymethyltransferase
MDRRVRVPDLKAKKSRGEKIAVLTAYDATLARLLDRAGVDVLLVGDSLGMVVLERALVVADMPFLTFQVNPDEAVRNAGRLLQEGGAAAVKLEGGRPVADVVKRLVDVGIPVMGHLGLPPQSVNQLGGYARRATEPREAEALLEDAATLERAGAFAIVLEAIPDELARVVTSHVAVPTIGIGAGPHCDGQVLVTYDMLGLFDRFVPSFVKQYAQLSTTIASAVEGYVSDVRAGRYPRVVEDSPVAPIA